MARYYDPLTADGPGSNKDYVPSYWADTAGAAPEDDGILGSDKDVDVAIIGGGYTGLVCAYHLNKNHNINAVVLEANRPGWGCSGRNGGFIRSSIGKLGYDSIIKAKGLDAAKKIYHEAAAAVDELLHLIEVGNIECDVIKGYLKVAHNHKAFESLIKEASTLKELFGYEATVLSSDELRKGFVNSDEGFGALFHPAYFGLHPLKLVYGYLRMARASGAVVHRDTQVQKIERVGERQRLYTSSGTVTAKKIVFATNGYTPEHLHRQLHGTIMPVPSQIVVTRPLTEQELDQCNLKSRLVMIDTRKINRYYRLLPDNRLLLGSRGALNETPAEMNRQQDALLRDIGRKFAVLKNIEPDYSWSGWVALTADWMPHVGQALHDPDVYYALGYGGSGISYSARAARLVAGLVAGKPLGDDVNDITSAPIPRFKFSRGRRIGRTAALTWLDLTDRFSS